MEVYGSWIQQWMRETVLNILFAMLFCSYNIFYISKGARTYAAPSAICIRAAPFFSLSNGTKIGYKMYHVDPTFKGFVFLLLRN